MTLLSATPVLRSGDFPRAKAFYMDGLGFCCVEEAGEPAGFGIFIRDKAPVFAEAHQGAEAACGRRWAYVHVDDFDAAVAELEGSGVAFSSAPTVTEHGMGEVEVTDPDGNVLCSGADADDAGPGAA
ncbi:MAG: VOC family protein [Pseudomonadota bacterium]